VNKISEKEDLEALGKVRRALALYTEAEDFIMAGGYSPGANPELDRAMKRIPLIKKFLVQAIDEKSEWETVSQALRLLARDPEPDPGMGRFPSRAPGRPQRN